MSLPIIQIKRRNKNTDEEYSTANQLNGLIEGELGYNYFDNGLWIGPQGSTDGRDYSILVNENHKLDTNSAQAWENGTTEGPRLILKEVDERSSDRHEVKTAAIPSATAGRSGVITTGDQAFAGMKTFRNIKIANSDGTYVATIEGPGATNTFKLPNTGGTFVTHATKGTAVGNSTKPVYIATTGRATAGSTYAGGTKVTLNNTNKGASTASFYAPTASGSANQVLFSAGANAEPVWADQSSINAGSVGGYTRANMYADMATWLNATGNVYTIIVEGDKDKLDMYYPVYIDLSASREVPTIVSVFKDLGSRTPAGYEGNHTNGTSSMWLLYEARNSYWDGNGGYVKTLYSYQGYAPLCAHMERANKGKGGLILWLRGGGDGCEYKIAVTNRLMATPTIYYEETNLGSSTHPITIAPKQGIATTDNRGIYSSTLLGYGDVRGNLQGNATSADHLKTARTIFGKSFDGSGNVAGKALVYGTRVATAGDRYYYGALEIRENGLVEATQTDISYAPTIGFHWGGKAAGTIALGSDAKFYAYKQNGTDKATFVTNVEGNASTASALKLSAQVGSGTQPIYFKADGTPTATTYALHKTVPSNALFTDASVKQEASTVDGWRPLLLHKNYANEGTDPGGATDQVHYNATIAANPKQGIVRATTFKGNLSGTADNAVHLKPLSLKPSGDTYLNYYTQFATAKVSKAWESFGGTFVISDTEASPICGIVRIKARTGSTYDVGVPIIEWIVLNREALLDAIVAVKNADGDYTYYIKNVGNWTTYQISCLQKDAAVTMTAGTSWVTKDTISAKIVATSSLKGMANTAEKFRTTRTIALSGDASGSTTFDGSTDATISVTVKDDSHNHIIANVDNLQTTLDSKLPLAGGTMTGLVNYKTTNYTSIPIKIYDDGTDYGHSLVIGADGTTYIGGGESAKALYDATYVPKSTEDLILSADSMIRFQTDVGNSTVNKKDKAKGIILDAANVLYPATSKNGSIGSASYRWNNGYFASVNTNSLLANRTGYTPFSIEATTDLVNKNLEAVSGDYLHHVFLLLPVPTSKDYINHNYIDGTFYCRKIGANVYDTVRVSINCVYNALYYYIDAFGQHTPWTLCRCTYNGIDYYALKCPYHANPYSHVEFSGRIKSVLPGGTHHETVRQPLPIDIAYYYTHTNGTTEIKNSEVYNSLSDTLTTSIITSTSIRRLHNYAGFTGPTIELTKPNTYNFIYTSGSSGLIALCANQTQAAANSAAIITSNALRPGATNTFALGNASYVWKSGHFKRLHLYGATNNDMTTASANPALVFAEAGANPVQPVYLMYTDYDTYRSPAGLKVFGEGEASPAWFEVEGTMFANKGVIGATSTSGSYDFYVNGTTYITGDTKIAGTLMLTKVQDAEASANTTQPALIVGGTQAGTHLEIDDNEIMAKSNGTTATTLYLNANGGAVSIGTGGLTCNGHIVPGTNNSYHLGSSSSNWKNLYVRSIHSSDALTLNSASGKTITLTSGSTLYLASGSGSSLIFQPQGTEKARFDTSGYFHIKTLTKLGDYGALGYGSTGFSDYSEMTAFTPTAYSVWLATKGNADKNETSGIYLDADTIKFWTPGDSAIEFLDSDAPGGGTYAGVKFGTVSAGTWEGSTIGIAYGGTGMTSNPSMLINLASTSAASVFTASPRPGVTGTLAISNGGTGITSNPSMLVNLGSTSAASVFAASPRPGVTGTLGVAHGGTGQTSLTSGYALIGNGTSAVSLRAIRNNTSIGGLGWTSATADTVLVTANTIAYWDGSYDGTTSHLKKLGTVTTGTWNATAIGVAYGGTGKTSWTANRLVYSSSSSALANANIYYDADELRPTATNTIYLGGSSYVWKAVYATTFYASSDIRKKKEITDLIVNRDILSLPLYQFKYIDNDDEDTHIGCMAQDLQQICPELVTADTDGYLSIKENRLVYILLDRMKKMQEEIEELKEVCSNGK